VQDAFLDATDSIKASHPDRLPVQYDQADGPIDVTA
jgi:hypothetical protein